LAVQLFDDNWDIWVLDIAREPQTRLTVEGTDFGPVWSADGGKVIFSSTRAGATTQIFSTAADGGGEAEHLTTGPYTSASSLSSDGNVLIFEQQSGRGDMDIGRLRLDGHSAPEIFIETESNERSGRISPDDRWLAYVSNESGRDEVYVQPFPERGRRVQISTEGGTEPVWSRDGRELFYRDGRKMMAVAVSSDTSFSAEKPTLLFEGPYATGDFSYDVTHDGRFVMIQTEREEGPTQINIVLNWSEELKRLVPPE
jgi:Tol biopolymer transport system component